jgi:hypothetical protein
MRSLVPRRLDVDSRRGIVAARRYI